MTRKFLNLFNLLIASTGLVSCGLGSGGPNAGTPSGTLVATGAMSGQASAQVSVYSQGGNTYAVQIASLSYSGSCSLGGVPSVGAAAGAWVGGPTLSAFSGTQNYTLTNLSTTPTEIVVYCNMCSSGSVQTCVIAYTATLNPA